MRWNCRTLGDQLSQYLNSRLGNWSLSSAERGDQAHRGQWKVYGQEDDLCSKTYSGKDSSEVLPFLDMEKRVP